MSAAGLWWRADLRRRWVSWVVLGLLAGASVGLGCAGVAGARRTERAVPRYAAAAHVPDAGILANDPAFDDAVRAEVARLPEVTALYPFMVAPLTHFEGHEELGGYLLPTTAASLLVGLIPVVEGRVPDPQRADEVVVTEQARALGLHVGSTLTFVQDAPPASFPIPVPPTASAITQPMHVVGILSGAGSDGPQATVSSGFAARYAPQLVGITNAFADLRGGSADVDRLRADVSRLMGKPVNVADGVELFGVRQERSVATVEATGLLLFAFAVLVGAGALVGQALVRAVTVGGADADTWRALGADRRLVVRALTGSSVVSAVVAAFTSVAVAVALSPRFPISQTRRVELDVGFHADWPVLAIGGVGVALAVVAAAWVTAELLARRRFTDDRPARSSRWGALFGSSPVLLIGSRLATEPGRGKRAVPVRSALVGAVAGVLGVVGCLTFRSGLSDVVAQPRRSGVVWDHVLARAGVFTEAELHQVSADPAVAGVIRATWDRALLIDGQATPVFGVAAAPDGSTLVVLAGRAPSRDDEIAFAPTTMRALGVRLGDEVSVGSAPGRPMRVVGRVLLPATSHTEYDQSGWITHDALMSLLGTNVDGDTVEDELLVRWSPDGDVAAGRKRLDAMAQSEGVAGSMPAALPPAVESLRGLEVLPMTLAVFFGLLAIATVAHALVTTVRRRRTDLAILRSMGFTAVDTRLAIAWQATALAGVGAALGVPAGLVLGRTLWRQFAENFPVAYVAPIAVLAVLLAIPVAVAVANALALGPARSAARVRPAIALRTE